MIFDWKISKNRRTGQITFYRTVGSLPVISCKPGFLKKPNPEVFDSELKKKKRQNLLFFDHQITKRKPKPEVL
jgi:hypothetical protein